MITAGITAAVAGILGLFGVKPGPYLIVVAGVVKVGVVGAGLVFGKRWIKKRQQKGDKP